MKTRKITKDELNEITMQGIEGLSAPVLQRLIPENEEVDILEVATMDAGIWVNGLPDREKLGYSRNRTMC